MEENKNKSELKIFPILAIISPFSCLFKGFINYNYSIGKWYVLVFFMFYSYWITTPILENDMDLFRRIDFFQNLANKNDLSFSEFSSSFYDIEGESADIFEPTLMYLISRFTHNYRILFLLYGFLFGLLYVKNLWFIYEKLYVKFSMAVFPIFLTLILVIPIWNINAFRFWFASQVFIYGLLRFYLLKNKKYFLISCFSIFIHFSYFFPIVIWIISFISIINLRLLYFIFIGSIILAEVNIQFISQYLDLIPGVLGKRASGYVGDFYLENVEETKSSVSLNWYVKFRYIGIKLYFSYLMFIIIFRLKSEINSNLISYFKFVLLLFSISNVISDTPPFDRFLVVCVFHCCVIYFFIVNKNILTLKLFNTIMVLSFSLYSIVELRIGFDTIGLISILGNFVTSSFFENNVAIIDIIKKIL